MDSFSWFCEEKYTRNMVRLGCSYRVIDDRNSVWERVNGLCRLAADYGVDNTITLERERFVLVMLKTELLFQLVPVIIQTHGQHSKQSPSLETVVIQDRRRSLRGLQEHPALHQTPLIPVTYPAVAAFCAVPGLWRYINPVQGGVVRYCP